MSGTGGLDPRERNSTGEGRHNDRVVIEHDARLCALASNPSLPTEIVSILIERGDEELLADLAERVNLEPTQVDQLVARGGPEVFATLVAVGRIPIRPEHLADDQILLRLAKRDLISADLLPTCARHPAARIRAAVASHPGLPAHVAAELAAGADVEVVIEVAGCAELPLDTARVLARHPDLDVRSSLAANRTGTVSAEILAELATTGGTPPITTCAACRTGPDGTACCGDHVPGIEAIRMAALQNPGTPVAALVPLVNHVEPWARAVIAARAGLPLNLVEQLADDTDSSVRAAVAENPETPQVLLRSLAEDHTSRVRRAVALNPAVPLDLLFELAAHTRLNLRAGIPRVEHATATQLRGLATSRTAQVRALAASCRDLPDDLREFLTWDSDAGVAKNLADHPALSADDLRLLAARHGPRLYSAIARNPHCPPELLHTMARNSHAVPKALREIAQHPATEPRTLLLCLSDPEARHNAARHPAVPIDVLTALLEHPDQLTCAAAAGNPSLPVETMRALINQAGH